MCQYKQYWACTCISNIELSVNNYLNDKFLDTLRNKWLANEIDVALFTSIIKFIIAETLNVENMRYNLMYSAEDDIYESYNPDFNDNIDSANKEQDTHYNPFNTEWYKQGCLMSKKGNKKHEVYIDPCGLNMEDEFQEYEYIETCYNTPGIITIIKSCFVSYLFNIIIEPKFKKIFTQIINNHESLTNMIKKKLMVDFKSDNVKCLAWKGSNYYFYQIFKYPLYLDVKYKVDSESIDLDNSNTIDSHEALEKIINKKKELTQQLKEHISIYNYKYDNDFTTQIEYHPMASNGACYEGLQELIMAGVII
jgi:hypothetical protein